MTVAVLLAGLAAVGAPRAFAEAVDGGMLAMGGSPHLMTSAPGIVMTWERVHARVGHTGARIVCEAVLRNTGAPRAVEVGFPDTGGADGNTKAVPFGAFRAFADGRAAPARFVVDSTGDEDEYQAWYVQTLRFARGQSRRLRAEYRGGVGHDGAGGRVWIFMLLSGASWQDTIGAADVVVTLEGLDPRGRGVRFDPPATSVTEHEVHWHFTTLAPGSNGLHAVRVNWTPADERPVKRTPRSHPLLVH